MGQRRAFLPVGTRPRGAAAVLVAALFVGTPAGAAELEQVEELAEEGARGLAVHLIHRHQPARTDDPGAWRRWEERRLELLAEGGEWAALVERVGDYPAEELETDFRHRVDERHAEALIRLERGRELVELAFRRLWLGDAPDRDEAAAWQRRLVTGWRLAGEPAAALATLERLPGDPEGGVRRQASLLLELDRPRAALRALKAGEGGDPALRLLAELRAGEREAEAVAAAADGALVGADREAVARLRRLVAHTATDPARRGAALARLLALGPEASLPGLPAATADDLWAAWREQGRAAANERGLLFGDHEAWLTAAEEAPAREKRALLATLAREVEDDEVR
ncbi:MAG: hypothetical protein ACLFTX_03940, partial [Thiohalospira sp.]